ESHAFRIERQIEARRGTIDDSAGSADRSTAHPALELIDIEPVCGEREQTTPFLQAERDIATCERRVHDADLTVDIRIGTCAVGVDVKAQLSGARDLGVKQLREF